MVETIASVDNRNLAERKLQTARRFLNKYVPAVVPAQPTVLELRPSVGTGDIAIYYGPLRKRHYIYLGQDFGISDNGVFETLAISHELVHQWHAEQMGPSLWWRVDPDSYITDREIETQPIEILLNKIARKSGGEKPSITDALTEGLATFIEFYIFEQYFNETSQGNHRVWRELKALKRTQSYDINYESLTHFHQTGLIALRQVYLSSGLDGVLDFIRNVDYEACNRIFGGTKKYFRMLARPERIPIHNGRVHFPITKVRR